MRYSENFIVMKRFAMRSSYGLSFYTVTEFKKRVYICMGVVKLDDAVNWDTKAMAEDTP